MAKKQVISDAEAKEILLEAARRVQHIDEEIKGLQDDKKEILKDIKDKGLSVTMLKKAIQRLREIKKNPSKEQELELYMEAISDVIEPIK